LKKAVLVFLVVSVLPGVARAETPSNGWIVFASDRQGGRHEIFLMKADGTNVSQLTTTGAKFPIWSPDGAWIAYRTEPTGRTRVMRWDKSQDKQIFTGEPLFFMHDGSGLVCADGDDLHLVNPDNGSSQYMFRKDDFSHMQGKEWHPGGISRNGRWLVTWTDRYRNGYTGTNGTFDSYHCAVILDIQNKGDIFFFGGGCEPTTPPSGNTFYHVCGNCPTKPDVYRMAVADRMSRSSYASEIAYADADWGHEYFPRISTDGTWLTYGASTGCHDHNTCQYEIFVHRLGAGNSNRERVTNNSNNDQWPHMYVGTLWGQQQGTLSLNPASLSFNATEGGSNPGPRDVAVSNSGGGTLNNVSASENAGWLSVSRSGSGNNQTLTNNVDISAVSAGTYNTTVTVNCSNATNSPQTYSVDLNVAEPAPLLALAPTSLAFGAAAGGGNPAPKDVLVSNSGGGSLDNVSASDDAGWLNVSRSGSGNNQTLTNNVDIAGLVDGTYDANVDVSCANASNSPQTYTVRLVISQQPQLASIQVTPATSTILPGGSLDLTAACRDQFDDPFAAVISWSASGGGSLAPPDSGSAVTEHTSTFTSDGSEGTFTVTAEAGGLSGTASVQVEGTALPLRINCGSNDYDVAGWNRDDPFVSGGTDWTNPNVVDTSGVVNAAPADVYKSVRHQSPHSYSIPVPDGDYVLRLHFADAYENRSMDYFVEGVQILSGFDIASEAGLNRALVKDFAVTVTGGDGMLVEAQSTGDVFECGLEILPPAVDEPGQDGGGGDDAGTQPDAGDEQTDTSIPPADADEEIVVEGGCSGCTTATSHPAALLLLPLLVLLRRRR
jgi:Tol biopolymer transport system component